MVDLYDDATSLLAQLRDRKLSSVELLDALRGRIEKLDGDINAVVARDFEAAKTRAQAADAARARGESWGPMHGLPMTIKDSFEVIGMPTTAGAPKLRTHQPTRNATAVQALVDAGAIVFGKTNLPVFAGEWQSFNPVYGTTRNPYDATRTPGGSSGGSAAAVAAGFTPIEVGSDIGGSIRIPCHFCGVFGHKPTHGAIDLRGHIPGPPGTMSEPDLAVAGPLARSARDLELSLDILTRRDEGYPALPPAPDRSPFELRVAVWRNDSAFPLEADVSNALDATVAALTDHGVRWSEEAPAGLRALEVLETYAPLLAGVIGSGLPRTAFRRLQWTAPIMKRMTRRQVDSPIPDLLIDGYVQTHRTWLSHNERRAKMGAKVHAWFENFDLLLMPVVPWTAPPHAHNLEILLRTVQTPSGTRPYIDHLSWVGLATALGLPATSVPIGHTPDGLPVGLQVVGPRRHDRRCLAFARKLEEVLGGFVPPPL